MTNLLELPTMTSRLALEQDAGPPTESEANRAVELFNAHGALWLENVLPVALVDKLAKAYSEKYTGLSNRELRKRDASVGDQRFMISINLKGQFNKPEVYASENLMPILERLLGSQIRIASFGSVVARPGAEVQPIHLDHPPLFPMNSGNDALPPHAITAVVPLVDIDPPLGSTAIWQGTHCSKDRIELVQRLMTEPDYSDAVVPLPRKGDVYLMDYRVIHGGLANQSDIARPILYIVYSRPWFRDGFNFQKQDAVKIGKKQLSKVPKSLRSLFS